MDLHPVVYHRYLGVYIHRKLVAIHQEPIHTHYRRSKYGLVVKGLGSRLLHKTHKNLELLDLPYSQELPTLLGLAKMHLTEDQRPHTIQYNDI